MKSYYTTSKHCKNCKYKCKLDSGEKALDCPLLEEYINRHQNDKSGLKRK